MLYIEEDTPGDGVTGPGPIDPKNPKEPPPGTTPPKKD